MSAKTHARILAELRTPRTLAGLHDALPDCRAIGLRLGELCDAGLVRCEKGGVRVQYGVNGPVEVRNLYWTVDRPALATAAETDRKVAILSGLLARVQAAPRRQREVRA